MDTVPNSKPSSSPGAVEAIVRPARGHAQAIGRLSEHSTGDTQASGCWAAQGNDGAVRSGPAVSGSPVTCPEGRAISGSAAPRVGKSMAQPAVPGGSVPAEFLCITKPGHGGRR
jgi:hypothetical protein